MTIVLTQEVEDRLRRMAEETGEEVNALAESLIIGALNDADALTEPAISEIRAGIQRGLDAAKERRERPLTEYVADLAQRRANRGKEAA